MRRVHGPLCLRHAAAAAAGTGTTARAVQVAQHSASGRVTAGHCDLTDRPPTTATRPPV